MMMDASFSLKNLLAMCINSLQYFHSVFNCGW